MDDMTATPRVALATQAALPDAYPDDQLLIPALAARGVHATAAVWSDSSVDWARFDAVVIRSCWDYHLRHDDFLAWVARLASVLVERMRQPVSAGRAS